MNIFNSCCKHTCHEICRRPYEITNIDYSTKNRSTNSSTMGAEFNLLESQLVPNGSVIPLTNTVYNNTGNYVTNDNGIIKLVGPGLYYVSYAVGVLNMTEQIGFATVNPVVDSTIRYSIGVSMELSENSVINTVSNSFLVKVENGKTSTIDFVVTAKNTYYYEPNAVILKLS